MKTFAHIIRQIRDVGSQRIAQQAVAGGYMTAWLVAAAISWRTIRDAASVYLALPWGLDWAYPLVIDGPMLTWSGVIWLSRRDGTSPGFATWGWLVAFGIVSAVANIAAHLEPSDDWHTAITVVMAALPPLAAIVSLERGARELSAPDTVPTDPDATDMAGTVAVSSPTVMPAVSLQTETLTSTGNGRSPVEHDLGQQPSHELGQQPSHDVSQQPERTPRRQPSVADRLERVWAKRTPPAEGWTQKTLSEAAKCSTRSAGRFLQKKRTETDENDSGISSEQENRPSGTPARAGLEVVR